MVESEKTIIQIIQDMIKQGEKEEKIIATLNQLGVEPQKAKQLLLLGEADTFAIIRNDITKIVTEKIVDEEKVLQAYIDDKISEERKTDTTKIKELVLAELETHQKENDQKIGHAIEIVEKTKINSLKLSERLRQIELELDSIKLGGSLKRGKALSMVLFIIGIAFLLADLTLFIMSFNQTNTIDNIIMVVIIAIVGITMLFVSTIS